jgi:hypothetical protein
MMTGARAATAQHALIHVPINHRIRIGIDRQFFFGRRELRTAKSRL